MTKIQKYIEYNFDKWYEFNENLVYKDLGISWTKNESQRPWLNQLKEDVASWKIDLVIVYRLDRLWRKTSIILDLIDFLKFHKVDFISTQENIDTSSPTGTFFMVVLSALAELEAQNITLKMRDWALEWVNKWLFTNWWKPGYWFEKDMKTKKIITVKHEVEIVKEIYHLYVEENKSLNQIANLLTSRKIPSKFDTNGGTRRNVNNVWKWWATLISNIISNEANIWTYWLNKYQTIDIIKKDKFWRDIKDTQTVNRPKEEWIAIECDTIIDPEIFHKAQKLRLENPYRNNNKNKPVINHLFSPFLKCWECGSRYKWEKWKPNKAGLYNYAYRCCKTNALKHWANKCYNSQIRESELTENIYDEINKFFKKPELIIKEFLNKNKQEDKSTKYKKEIEENNLQIKKSYSNVEILYDKFLDETNSKFKEIIDNKISNHKTNIEKLEKRNIEIKKILLNQTQIIKDTQDFEKYIERYKGKNIYKFSLEEKRIVLDKIIKEIVVFNDDVRVVFLFKDINNESNEDSNTDTKKPVNLQNENLPAGVFEMVGHPGLEPRTFSLKGSCSTNWANNPSLLL